MYSRSKRARAWRNVLPFGNERGDVAHRRRMGVQVGGEDVRLAVRVARTVGELAGNGQSVADMVRPDDRHAGRGEEFLGFRALRVGTAEIQNRFQDGTKLPAC